MDDHRHAGADLERKGETYAWEDDAFGTEATLSLPMATLDALEAQARYDGVSVRRVVTQLVWDM